MQHRLNYEHEARLVTLTLLVAAGMMQARGERDGASQNKPVTPNRTVPKVKPPTTGLEFSANPTTQEITRARVFEESLVSIGGNPSAEENATLATALLGYAKRSGPQRHKGDAVE